MFFVVLLRAKRVDTNDTKRETHEQQKTTTKKNQLCTERNGGNNHVHKFQRKTININKQKWTSIASERSYAFRQQHEKRNSTYKLKRERKEREKNMQKSFEKVCCTKK